MISYDSISYHNAHFIPNTVHGESTLSREYFIKLLHKAVSIFEFDGTPETWDMDFFLQVLFLDGKLCVANYGKFGVLPLNCTLSGYNIFYRPDKCLVTNPCLSKNYELKIGKDCEVIKMKLNYCGIADMLSEYADRLALCTESEAMNLVNSKLSYVFACKNQGSAQSFKKMFDSIQKGDPAVFPDRSLFDKDGNVLWDTFAQNLAQNFIAPDISALKRNIESEFDAELGINNVGKFEKAERMITSEVESDTESREANVETMFRILSESIDKVNAMFNLNITVKMKYKQEETEYDTSDLNGDGDLQLQK